MNLNNNENFREIILKKVANSLCEIKLNKKIAYGFFCYIKFENEKKFCLILNDEEMVNEILYNFFDIEIFINNNILKIPLNVNRNVWRNKDFICLEIEENDIMSLIPEPFEIDENNINYNLIGYENNIMYIPAIRETKKIELLECKIILNNDIEFKFENSDLDTYFYVCPIILANNSCILGIYKGKNNNNYTGIFLKQILGNIAIENKIELPLSGECEIYCEFWAFTQPQTFNFEVRDTLQGNIITQKKLEVPPIVTKYGVVGTKLKYSNGQILDMPEITKKKANLLLQFLDEPHIFEYCGIHYPFGNNLKEKKICILKRDLYKKPQIFYYDNNKKSGKLPIFFGNTIEGYLVSIGELLWDEKKNELAFSNKNGSSLSSYRLMELSYDFNFKVNINQRKIDVEAKKISIIDLKKGMFLKGKLILNK